MMKYGDRVQETSSTTGTGSLTLAGATEAHRSFASELANGDECTILIQVANGAWELSKATLSGGSTLSRTLVKSSTGALLDLPAGEHYVSLVTTSELFNETVRSVDIRHIVTITQAAYDLLDPPDTTTLYIVTPE